MIFQSLCSPECFLPEAQVRTHTPRDLHSPPTYEELGLFVFSAQSCQGRCGEAFSRGRACECDQQCVLYNTCCHDYQTNCGRGQHIDPLYLNNTSTLVLHGNDITCHICWKQHSLQVNWLIKVCSTAGSYSFTHVLCVHRCQCVRLTVPQASASARRSFRLAPLTN